MTPLYREFASAGEAWGEANKKGFCYLRCLILEIMAEHTFRKWNLITGWAVFLVAAITYLLTVEPTVSWWDCGEFISSAYKLEVGHPPGAPLFALVARIFTIFAGDPSKVALSVNIVSALSSAFTILFLFWSVTHLALKMVKKAAEISLAEGLAVLGAGTVGALVYTFSDSFWFSAVEGEVYAMSSLFTALVFWAILKWESQADDPSSLRWIIFIAFLMGLSIGVHLLNLVAIPAIVFIYYFKKFPVTKKGVLTAFLLSILILGAVMYVILPGVVLLATWFELFFINLVGLPYHFGMMIFFILLAGLITWGLIETKKRGSLLWNTVILAGTFIIIGYSTYGMILIRSNANTPMEQNNPDMVFNLKRYLDREQYGDRPLLYGQYYNAPLIDQIRSKPVYSMVDGKYEATDYDNKIIYDKRFLTIFPRMWSNNSQHPQSYQEWAQIEGTTVQTTSRDGQPITLQRPKFSENLRFFFSYQLGHMYFRYFMWNFVGRQNDMQSQGGTINGNWISGINFMDEARLGPLDQITDAAKNHKSRNTYFFLPLLLGLFGAIYQYRKKQTDFWVIFLLFVYTGIAIVVYLNQFPDQPRERDYAYVGSFYAFSIWVGLGVIGLFLGSAKLLKANSKKASLIAIPVIILGLIVPTLMAFQNWDDHDRSNRYIARDFAHNYLNSCAPNAILFTNGDNDTFPLWYAQEVEGYRTDVRVVCLPYLNTDWYIDQMKRQAYDSDPVPFTLEYLQYRQGTRDYMPVYDRTTDTLDLRTIINYVASDREETRQKYQDGMVLDIVPGRHFRIPVDSALVLRNGTVPPEDANLIVPSIEWILKRNTIFKNDLMILDLIAYNNWARPIYFTSIAHENIMGLQEYFRLEGFAYRFVPIRNPRESGLTASINTNILYDNLMNKFHWGNMEKPDVFVDYYTWRTSAILRVRYNFVQLADQLLAEGDHERSLAVLDRIIEIMPKEQFPYDIFIASIAETYYKNEAIDKGNYLIQEYFDQVYQELEYFLSVQKRYGKVLGDETNRTISVVQELLRITGMYNQNDLSEKIETSIKELATIQE